MTLKPEAGPGPQTGVRMWMDSAELVHGGTPSNLPSTCQEQNLCHLVGGLHLCKDGKSDEAEFNYHEQVGGSADTLPKAMMQELEFLSFSPFFSFLPECLKINLSLPGSRLFSVWFCLGFPLFKHTVNTNMILPEEQQLFCLKIV